VRGGRAIQLTISLSKRFGHLARQGFGGRGGVISISARAWLDCRSDETNCPSSLSPARTPARPGTKGIRAHRPRAIVRASRADSSSSKRPAGTDEIELIARECPRPTSDQPGTRVLSPHESTAQGGFMIWVTTPFDPIPAPRWGEALTPRYARCLCGTRWALTSRTSCSPSPPISSSALYVRSRGRLGEYRTTQVVPCA